MSCQAKYCKWKKNVDSLLLPQDNQEDAWKEVTPKVCRSRQCLIGMLATTEEYGVYGCSNELFPYWLGPKALLNGFNII